jgi:hypothetical protein
VRRADFGDHLVQFARPIRRQDLLNGWTRMRGIFIKPLGLLDGAAGLFETRAQARAQIAQITLEILEIQRPSRPALDRVNDEIQLESAVPTKPLIVDYLT